MIDNIDINEFIKKWHSVPSGSAYSQGRDNLCRSDKCWQYILEKRMFPVCSADRLIYRVHVKYPKPNSNGEEYTMTVYPNRTPKEQYTQDLERWRHQEEIRWDKHWVSFTKNAMVICSDYFREKQMRGMVCVLKAKDAIDISGVTNQFGFQEDEVVARMDQANLVEVLPFEAFMSKYGQ